jgi:hypothetical protein
MCKEIRERLRRAIKKNIGKIRIRHTERKPIRKCVESPFHNTYLSNS